MFPSGLASAFTDYSTLKDNTGSFTKDINEKSEHGKTAPSHHDTIEHDLSGVPLDIYATPNSHTNQSHQTTLLDNVSELNETQ
jgi:hypothetical protein